jgi:hypothetical protein
MSSTRSRKPAESSNETSERKSALRDAIKKDEARAQSRAGGLMPFRFYQERDAECEIVILDNSMDDAFWRQEHNLQIGGKWGNHEPCIAESGPCPHCEAGSKPALVVLLTALVIRPYKNKKTGKTTKYTKMLLPLKRKQYPAFDNIESIAMKKHGTLRGTCVLMYRDNDETSFSTGMPINNEDGNIINDWLDEKALVKEFGHDPVKGTDGKVYKKADEDIVPFDYKKLFPKVDEEEVREQHGITTPGSSRANRREQEADADEIPDVPSPRSRRSAPAEEEQEEEAPAPRSRRAPAPEPAPAPRSRRAAPVEQEEEEEQEQEEEDAPAPSRRGYASSRTSGRSRPNYQD